jgi:hypothetical protein
MRTSALSAGPDAVAADVAATGGGGLPPQDASSSDAISATTDRRIIPNPLY